MGIILLEQKCFFISVKMLLEFLIDGAKEKGANNVFSDRLPKDSI